MSKNWEFGDTIFSRYSKKIQNGGLLFHLFMDFFHLRNLGSLRVRAYSLVEFFLRKRALEKQGIFPCLLHQEAAKAAARL